MARIRSIKPEFWVSEQVLNLSIPAKLAFIGLWTFCDDYGNHPASHVSLAAQIFPNNNDATPDHLREWMAEILRQGLISEYEAGGHAYWHVTGWARHQHIQKRSPPKYPLPEHYRSTTGTLPEEDESGTGVVWGGEGIGEGEGIGIGEERPPHAPRGARLPLDWEPPKALKTWARTSAPTSTPSARWPRSATTGAPSQDVTRSSSIGMRPTAIGFARRAHHRATATPGPTSRTPPCQDRRAPTPLCKKSRPTD